jgi:hypothetical protein
MRAVLRLAGKLPELDQVLVAVVFGLSPMTAGIIIQTSGDPIQLLMLGFLTLFSIVIVSNRGVVISALSFAAVAALTQEGCIFLILPARAVSSLLLQKTPSARAALFGNLVLEPANGSLSEPVHDLLSSRTRKIVNRLLRQFGFKEGDALGVLGTDDWGETVEGPADGEGGVVPTDGALASRKIGVGGLVQNLRRVRQNEEAVGEAFGDPQHCWISLMIHRLEMESFVFAEGR